ncbi:acetate/propionate family kinase [Gayadomonas joobiniege]|uniref:acetate/propionate family kinase n=1 Tax=Gayadomonas joobiniege TaxID=1234606 RepID=UPI00037C8780|nr:acetate kinase [Gayadomonas joobiniege]
MEPNNILVINAGSSSLKFKIFNAGESQTPVLSGLAERLNTPEAELQYRKDDIKEQLNKPNADHKSILLALFELLEQFNLKNSIVAIGHRVVHGGEYFKGPALVNSDTIKKIAACSALAPLHNPANLLGIEAAQQAVPDLPQVVVFDTAFHQSMPEQAYMYALPKDYYQQHSIRKYGFHGTSHDYVSKEAARRLNLDLHNSGIITAHLGNGSSVCAVKNGLSVDTSMGFTPLEGLVMGTRSGDIDPGVLQFLNKQLGLSLDEILNVLNRKSGLLGLSGTSNDMRTLVALSEQGNIDAQIAFSVFCYRLAKTIASYMASLERFDALVFTGGIGENCRPARRTVLNQLKLLGLNINEDLNLANGDELGRISQPDSEGPTAIIIETQEEWMIANATHQLTQAGA